MGRRAHLIVCAAALAACEQSPGALPPPAPAFVDVDAAVAAMAWPDDAPPPGGRRPRIGMAPLPRPLDWPHLRAWTVGLEVPRAPTQTPDASSRELEILGEQVFRRYCASCHGGSGRGNGPRGRSMRPRPRDFTRSVFRYRSTPTGQAPTAEDLFRTVSGGLHGTGMMAFADLPERQRWAVVMHVRELAKITERSARPVVVPPVPADLHAPIRVRRGEAVYARLRCGECHGAGGAADGPAAPGLRDDLGRPIPVRNLRGQPLKRGDDPVQTFLTLVTGLDGSPMPSYAASATPDELWSLVARLSAWRRGP